MPLVYSKIQEAKVASYRTTRSGNQLHEKGMYAKQERKNEGTHSSISFSAFSTESELWQMVRQVESKVASDSTW